MNIIKAIKVAYAKKKILFLREYIPKKGNLLDFGCGDLSLAKEIKRMNPKLRITGVDVVDFGEVPKNIKFILYKGGKLPFKNNTFTAVIAYHVFHHCSNPKNALLECLRVSRNQVIFVEPVYRSKFEIPFMRMTDWVYNFWKKEHISMPYIFFGLEKWKRIINKLRLHTHTIKPLDNFSRCVPIGQTYLFSILKK